MVGKDDKDGQIRLLRNALQEIFDMVTYNGEPDCGIEYADEIAHIAQTALFDTTY